MAYVDQADTTDILFILVRPDGQMAQFSPSLDMTDMKAKADQVGGIIIGVPVVFVYDGRTPGASPHNPRPGHPPVSWPRES